MSRTKTRKQPFLHPEVEPPHHADLDDLAEDYFRCKHQTKVKRAAEKEAEAALIGKMKEHELTIYITPDELVVTVIDKQNVTCKKKDKENTNGEAEE